MPSPTIRYGFSPMGSVLEPAAGEIAMDVGSQCAPGILDHHFVGAGDHCAATLVVAHPEHVLGFLESSPADVVTLRVHSEPDFDCLTSSWLARRLILDGSLPNGAEHLAEYARAVDAGKPPPDGLGADSLWALYTAACELIPEFPEGYGHWAPDRQEKHLHIQYTRCLDRGLQLLDTVMQVAPRSLEQVRVPPAIRGWAREQIFLGRQLRAYENDRRRAVTGEIDLPSPHWKMVSVRGMWITDPECALFKHFARQTGYVFTHVVYAKPHSRAQERRTRHVISVAPEQGVWLRGLGMVLEGRECSVRAERGRVRTGTPRWPDVTNDDPWYDGRSAIHGYTIVDSPRSWSLIPLAEITELAKNVEDWSRKGSGEFQVRCSRGCTFHEIDALYVCQEHHERLEPTVIGGRYLILGRLGTGGVGSVMRVEDLLLERRQFALKIISRDSRSEQNPQQRAKNAELFLQEARAANLLRSEHIVGFHHQGDDSRVGMFIVSEIVEGTDLETDLSAYRGRSEPYPWPRAKRILLHICSALAEVHKKKTPALAKNRPLVLARSLPVRKAES